MADDDYDDDQSASCPRCGGCGEIDCHCGGDLCVCDNYGDAPCPLCHGEGVIGTEQYEKYLAAQREWVQALRTAFGGGDG